MELMERFDCVLKRRLKLKILSKWKIHFFYWNIHLKELNLIFQKYPFIQSALKVHKIKSANKKLDQVCSCFLTKCLLLAQFHISSTWSFPWWQPECNDIEKNVLLCAISRDDVGRAWLWVIKAKFDAEFCKWLIRPIQVKLIQNFTTSAWRSGKFLRRSEKKSFTEKEAIRDEMERGYIRKSCVCSIVHVFITF